MKNSLICADDFMITKGVSLAILDLLKHNKINSTSVMVVFTKNNYYGNILKKKLKKKQTIGLHLVLTYYKPLYKFKNIKTFSTILKLIINLITKKITEFEIEQEIKMQIFEFKKIFGHLPKYIDGHHHVHQLPIISKIFVKVIRDIYKKDKPFVRNTGLDFKIIFFNNQKIIKSCIMSLIGKLFKAKLKKNLIPTNSYFFGIYDFKNIDKFEKNIKLYFKFKNKNSIIMVHPGYVDKEIKKLDSLTEQRFYEYQYLKNLNFI